MDITMHIEDNQSGKLYDVSDLVGDITWETQIESQPGKLTFALRNGVQDAAVFYEGAPVSFRVGSRPIFAGFVFEKSRTKDNRISVTAYDQTRYLQNKDTYVFKDMTSDAILTKLCADTQLKCNIVDASSYVVAPVVHDNKSLYDMIQDALDKTFAYTGKRYMIRDNFGVIEHLDVETLHTGLVIGDKSLLSDFDYKSSIDSDTYNQVKITQENKETAKRDVYIVKDSDTIRQWGLLQYYETADENANAQQIASKADMLLKLKNRVTRTLTLRCIGDLRVFAGCGVALLINNLGDLAVGQSVIISKCTHNFANSYHSMTLEVETL